MREERGKERERPLFPLDTPRQVNLSRRSVDSSPGMRDSRCLGPMFGGRHVNICTRAVATPPPPCSLRSAKLRNPLCWVLALHVPQRLQLHDSRWSQHLMKVVASGCASLFPAQKLRTLCPVAMFEDKQERETQNAWQLE